MRGAGAGDRDKRNDAERQRTVAVPLVALVAAGVAVIASIVVIAFFVGRESARKDPASVAAVAVEPAASSAVGSDRDTERPETGEGGDRGSPRSDFEALFPPELNTGLAPGEADAESRMPETPPDAGGTAAQDTAVSGYFRELDSVEREAKYWSNPQDLAMMLLGQVGSGDTSGFDQLVGSQRQALDRVRRINPPPPCTDHHRRVVSLMGRGVSLLETVRDAAVAGDSGGLMALPTQAQQLESEARQVDALGEQLRQRFGVSG